MKDPSDQAGHRLATSKDVITSEIYLPNQLFDLVTGFASLSNIPLHDAMHHLLSKGLVSQDAREYLEMLLERNSLRRSELYSDYARDGLALRGMVDQMNRENTEIRRILLERGLLRKIPEKHRT